LYASALKTNNEALGIFVSLENLPQDRPGRP
jgi:hypothetical protein